VSPTPAPETAVPAGEALDERLRPSALLAASGRALAALPHQPPMVLIAGTVLAIHVVVAATGPLWAPDRPDELLVDRAFASPSWRHLLGTDNFGRDVFSRLVYGERIMLALALAAAGIATLAGAALGIVTAYLRGWVDETVGRVNEIVLTIPPLIISLLVLGAVGSSYPLVVALVAFFFAARVATVIRAATLDVVTEDFVTSARLRGESTWSIAARELFPNVLASVLVEFSLRTGYAVLFIAGLSFLGFGASPPTPDWGLMINEGRSYIATAPWPVLGPSLALASLVIGLSLFTEGIGAKLGLTVQRERER
jgi:peptide/nickel transport system permease protein